MFKNKLLTIALIIIIAIALLGVVALFLWQTYLKPQPDKAKAQSEQKISADEFQKVTVETDQIPTNLLTGEIVMAQFAMQADTTKTKDELDKRKLQITHIIIETLATLKPDDIKGAKGLTAVENDIKKQVNTILTDGQVVKVMTTHMVLQQ
ncbi:flagellar basal body-associated FliL family protein [Aneurinibacillus sp. Ricciae_BoGa-3]|uniref:flagellar basal body-associated FliL family protein n=1 Tax=Aneurinibacillus sp. Ricciae_BoGa-3 TaxID=3022697 RepID=UPI0023418A49|nr:flagellar basal body-associated FliL family protein [Aneurinibacillus sp. Ricciae_BoGa-3]WCK52890.1 flagellar basal body-associated FliL family protein [Aneurinibacillus sp. Ricciae_BoGa-3]